MSLNKFSTLIQPNPIQRMNTRNNHTIPHSPLWIEISWRTKEHINQYKTIFVLFEGSDEALKLENLSHPVLIRACTLQAKTVLWWL